MTSFKLAKDSVTRLKHLHQSTELKTKKQPHQRNRANEIAQKLETVNGEIDANTPHIVPPERT
ncbi:TPA: hypothetical protein I7676_21220 [Vibrio vulnificus]|nr:hypothetical protein [Vibrio vulnificus]HAS8219223.1 hypothetical protein [Vibrio vulnificus]HAS8299904.1 hypothetical protein [Vibrio vulnificus]